ncbi:MAG TPA: sterol desaturase family protein [Aggregicoccus sp.]|nr:sterol desaturase family protein [Aggregicoccus sp.]
MSASLPPSVASFRADYRARMGPRYRGALHLAFTSLASLGVIAFALTRLHQVRPWEWLLVPLTFVIANAAEYFGHRGPMHRPARGLRLIYRRHTLEHHHFFTHEAMAYESRRDFKMVLFPPVLLLFFLGGIATPLGVLLFLGVSHDAGWLFVATAMGYFLTYEWLHFAYHLPAQHPLARSRLMRALRRHHTVHHDLRRMGQHNFNISFPLFDRVMGTTWRERERE